MDTLVNIVVAGIPNFAIAVWCLYAQQKTISKLLNHQQQLIDELMKMCAEAKTPTA